ncbi:MAG: copper transporter [Armatimonadetes bacterium]|nr:copper transporter [Armatimonadota bacterium]
MVDVRYHIYSLVAVFVALAVGILLGVAVAGGPGAQKEAINKQTTRILGLEKQFRTYSERLQDKQNEIVDLQEDLKQADKLVSVELPALVQGQLLGRGVVVIQIGQSGDSARLQDTLKASGATIRSVTRIRTSYGFDNPEKLQAAAKLLPVPFQSSGADAHQQLWSYVASVLSQGQPGQPFAMMSDAGVLESEGDYSHTCRLAVVLAPSEAAAKSLKETVIAPLIAQLKADNMTVVVAFSSASDDKHPAQGDGAALWQDLDTPTVAHADYALGQICVVDALVHNEGSYGLGPGQQLVPRRLIER